MTKLLKTFQKLWGVLLLLLVLFLAKDWIYQQFFSQPEIDTQSILTQIQDLSQLATFQSTYNGITEITGRIQYKNQIGVIQHVYYMATLKLGIDFQEIQITNHPEEKILQVTYPPATILSQDVHIESLEFIQVEDTTEDLGNIQSAYGLCQHDLQQKSAGMTDLILYAEENAENTLRAIVLPFLKQYDPDYQLTLEKGGSQ